MAGQPHDPTGVSTRRPWRSSTSATCAIRQPRPRTPTRRRQARALHNPNPTSPFHTSHLGRFRRARGTERQQLRWLAWGDALAAVALVAAIASLALDSEFDLLNVTLGISAAVLPLATGAAILRYRLYDLDRLVSRTVAYGLLTVLLGLGYAVVVLGLGRLLPEGSSLVVAAATLAAAAVFQPLRRRIQQAVDRRFNRRRHDAGRLIEAFGARLRDQVDLDALHNELLAVVDQTIQPTRASLWLRPPAGGSR